MMFDDFQLTLLDIDETRDDHISIHPHPQQILLVYGKTWIRHFIDL